MHYIKILLIIIGLTIGDIMETIKSILFVMVTPAILVTIFFTKQIEVESKVDRGPALEVNYVSKRYDFSRAKLAFRE